MTNTKITIILDIERADGVTLAYVKSSVRHYLGEVFDPHTLGKNDLWATTHRPHITGSDLKS